MRFIKLTSLLILLSVVFTGCIQISFPQSQRPSEKTEEAQTGEGGSKPTVDTEEDTTPLKPVLDERGSVSSTEADSVILRADWKAISYDGKNAEVTVTVYLTFSKLSAGKSTGRVTLNGQTKTFSVKAIEKQAGAKVTITPSPAEFKFRIALTQSGTTALDLETVWNVKATIDGSYEELLSAEAVFPLWTTPEADGELESSTDTDSVTGTGRAAEDSLPTPTREDSMLW